MHHIWMERFALKNPQVQKDGVNSVVANANSRHGIVPSQENWGYQDWYRSVGSSPSSVVWHESMELFETMLSRVFFQLCRSSALSTSPEESLVVCVTGVSSRGGSFVNRQWHIVAADSSTGFIQEPKRLWKNIMQFRKPCTGWRATTKRSNQKRLLSKTPVSSWRT